MNSAKFNAKLKKGNVPYKIYKGNGYFFFYAENFKVPLAMDTFMGNQSIFMNSFAQASDEFWNNLIDSLIKDYHAHAELFKESGDV